MSKNYQYDVELNKLLSSAAAAAAASGPNDSSLRGDLGPSTYDMLSMKLKQQQQSSVALLGPSLRSRPKGKLDPITGMMISYQDRSLSPSGFSSQQQHFDLNQLSQLLNSGSGGGATSTQSLLNSTQSKAVDSIASLLNGAGGGLKATNMNPSIQGFPKKIYKTNNDNNDVLNSLSQQHKLQMAMGQPITKGRQIVKQNNHWPESSDPKSLMDFSTGSRNNNFGDQFGQQKSFRNGGESAIFGNDFGGEFATPPTRDIFSQAAMTANSSFPIGTFSVDSSMTSNSNNNHNSYASKERSLKMKIDTDSGLPAYGDSSFGQTNGFDTNNIGTLETGIIEKLLHSYGFIQCCERQARLFFHFSQFCANIEHLKVGDPVEFEMTYDRRTGKPIACSVKKIAPEVVLSEERVTGTVTTEIKVEGSVSGSGSSNSNETTGRISYENRGECFFLPYTKDDVEGNVTLCSGDKVSFQVATNQRGNLGACHIRLENPVHPVKYRGVVCSMKESFGFIERADVVKEIFFHFSEADPMELRPGDDVEFIIQTRNGKEVACNLARLTPGSVIFEDVGTQIYKGQVLKPLDRNNPLRQVSDPLPGRIRYRAADHSEVEVPFGDKDQKGDFTLRHGDWVQFLLATDRRDSLQRATSISLLDETFEVSGEKREQGMVAALKEGFGFIRCVERTTRLFFHFAEVLDTVRAICVDDEVEFTVIQDPTSSFANSRQNAIRIKHLPEGTVEFETLIEKNVEGVITREAPKSPGKSLERTEGGVITYDSEETKKTIMYFLKDCDKIPRMGDQVRFNICQVKRNKELIAINIKDISSPIATTVNGKQASADNDVSQAAITGPVFQGFIAVLKDNFGFIETVDHDEEVFFHFSNFHGNTANLELGQEVEYTLTNRGTISNGGNCLPAENVKVLPRGTIVQPKVMDVVYSGVVERPPRCINPEQEEYSGQIVRLNEGKGIVSTHEFGITSLINKRDLIQKDDDVSFKLDESNRAVEVNAIRSKNRATVDSIKGVFGFLDFDVEEGRKLFFHMSEVQGNANNLHNGDTVEFSIVKNQRTGKSSACNVVKVMDSSTIRPERLLARLKINSVDESAPRVIVTRTPKGPDGSKGFAAFYRNPRIAGVISE